MRIDQSIFRENWDALVTLLKQMPEYQDLPYLKEGGNCCGLSLTLAYYVSYGQQQEFYRLYHALCALDPVKFFASLQAGNADAGVNEKQLNKFINFTRKVGLLQNLKNTDTMQTDFERFKTDHHRWIGNDFLLPENQALLTQSQKSLKKNLHQDTHFGNPSALADVLQNLPDGQALYFVCHHKSDLYDAHAMLVYRQKGTLIAFDPNIGEEKRFSDQHAAARFLVVRTNAIYRPRLLDVFLDWIGTDRTTPKGRMMIEIRNAILRIHNLGSMILTTPAVLIFWPIIALGNYYARDKYAHDPAHDSGNSVDRVDMRFYTAPIASKVHKGAVPDTKQLAEALESRKLRKNNLATHRPYAKGNDSDEERPLLPRPTRKK